MTALTYKLLMIEYTNLKLKVLLVKFLIFKKITNVYLICIYLLLEILCNFMYHKRS